jgi:hypothetical protein
MKIIGDEFDKGLNVFNGCCNYSYLTHKLNYVSQQSDILSAVNRPPEVFARCNLTSKSKRRRAYAYACFDLIKIICISD